MHGKGKNYLRCAPLLQRVLMFCIACLCLSCPSVPSLYPCTPAQDGKAIDSDSIRQAALLTQNEELSSTTAEDRTAP